MKLIRSTLVRLALVFVSIITLQAQDPLPSWNDTTSKKAIVAFVDKVTTEGSPDFVPPNERIPTFANDGTLWCEQPLYFQLLLALARLKTLAPHRPDTTTEAPSASLSNGNVAVA